MIFSYFSIQKPAEALYKEKGSRFIAFAFPVSNEEEIKSNLQALRKKYFDATHHCYAYVLNPEKNIYRAVDDGEPNHSAGTPILNQIKSKDLTNILVVVVRYFGGTKLGVGGLVQAYKAAADQVLQNAVSIEIAVTVVFNLKFDYEAQPEVMKLIKEFDLQLLAQHYSSMGEMQVRCLLKEEKRLIEKLNLLKALRNPIQWQKAES